MPEQKIEEFQENIMDKMIRYYLVLIPVFLAGLCGFAHAGDRITSYNVCYTKLLRGCSTS